MRVRPRQPLNFEPGRPVSSPSYAILNNSSTRGLYLHEELERTNKLSITFSFSLKRAFLGILGESSSPVVQSSSPVQ